MRRTRGDRNSTGCRTDRAGGVGGALSVALVLVATSCGAGGGRQDLASVQGDTSTPSASVSAAVGPEVESTQEPRTDAASSGADPGTPGLPASPDAEDTGGDDEAGTPSTTTVPAATSSSGNRPSTTVSTSAPEGGSSPTTDGTWVDGEPSGQGVVAIQPATVDGYFIEGFEIGLRFETASGQVIASGLWSDIVAAEGDGSIAAYYRTVHSQAVPAGPIVVRASTNVGLGPAPVRPDPLGALRCAITVDVAPGSTVAVEVGFERFDCLRLG